MCCCLNHDARETALILFDSPAVSHTYTSRSCQSIHRGRAGRCVVCYRNPPDDFTQITLRGRQTIALMQTQVRRHLWHITPPCYMRPCAVSHWHSVRPLELACRIVLIVTGLSQSSEITNYLKFTVQAVWNLQYTHKILKAKNFKILWVPPKRILRPQSVVCERANTYWSNTYL